MRIAVHSAAVFSLAALLVLSACTGERSSIIGRSAVSVARESQAENGSTYALGSQFESQLEDMISKEVAALGGKETVPMELNRQVLLNINYFLNDNRKFMISGLSRGSKYIPMMKAIFRQKGLPEDLVYLALIESGFQTQAVSHAQAVGPWQFIAATGRRYGLTINEYVDERRDPVKSTYAAADYLTALHDIFNSWPLAIAAYNSGEGKIMKGMKNFGVDNFWDMTDLGGHLANETKLYVPSFLAATFIAKAPGAYGLEIEQQPPDQWNEVVVPAPISLKDAAEFAGTDVERLKELNPHLRKDSTPPNEDNFILRIPDGSINQFAQAYERLGKSRAMARVEAVAAKSASEPRLSTITHKVKAGDTLGSIATLYGVSAGEIKKGNELKGDTVKVGQILKIKSDLPLTTKKTDPGPVMVVESKKAITRKMGIHIVASGESLGLIAQKYNMSLKELADINGLKGSSIQIGQKLKVAGGGPATARAGSKTGVHVVAAGENVGGIARSYGLSVKELMTLNKLENPNIKIGQKLKVGDSAQPAAAAKMMAKSSGASSEAVHVVAAGENVGGIARKYDLSAKELMALNNMDNPNIRIGQKLKVKKQAAASGSQAGGSSRASAGLHTVSDGESLGVIAQKYGLSVADLKSLNNLQTNDIRIGQKLKVGGRAQASSSGGASASKAAGGYKVVEGDTLYSIARKNNLSVDELRKINKLEGNSLRLGQMLKLK